jgi:hypothetical protein
MLLELLDHGLAVIWLLTEDNDVELKVLEYARDLVLCGLITTMDDEYGSRDRRRRPVGSLACLGDQAEA